MDGETEMGESKYAKGFSIALRAFTIKPFNFSTCTKWFYNVKY